MTTYVALTSEGKVWWPLCKGSDKEKVTARAEKRCGDPHPAGEVAGDIYAQSRLKNLRVVSKTIAKRKFHVDIDAPAGEEVLSPDYEPLEDVDETARVMSRLGKIRTPRKAKTSAANGRSGGRPVGSRNK